MKSKVEQRKKGTKPPFFRSIAQGQPTPKELGMTETVEQKPKKKPIQCWGYGGDHMRKYYPQKGDKARIVHSVQQAMTVEFMGRNVPRIYAALDNKQVEFHSHMIEVEGKINDQPIVILIDSGASHGYLNHKIVQRFQLSRSKLEKYWLVQLSTGEKRKINETVKACLMEMNGPCTKDDLNILPLGSYDCLIGMDWLDQYHVVIDCYNKAFTCLDDEGNIRTVQGIPRTVTIREVSTLQLKKSYRRGCQVFAMHVEKAPKDKVPNVEDCVVLK
jgi:hypothetical protein